MNVCKGKEN